MQVARILKRLLSIILRRKHRKRRFTVKNEEIVVYMKFAFTLERMVDIMRLCDIVDIKSAFMEKTDLSEEEIQTIIDDIPTAFDGDKVIEQLEEYGTCKDKCSNKSCCYSCKDDVIDRSDAIDIIESGGINEI